MISKDLNLNSPELTQRKYMGCVVRIDSLINSDPRNRSLANFYIPYCP